ncbi:hypothetical protein M2158_001445 [Streptomyces sp. SAI-144]|uniref:DUF2510 domain-containing protein n=1 Tax=unclassified Streptomyces TaxID=2593676 RepID=UPI0024747086|nr:MULTISPECIES: DUF2510 domain-containing protein [unclassified Streptomyces]MDH6432968.1 hypothetical protein [Streptomyces sp. SAI-144]MDH6491664.1 hypothetical protein [Streptomyces sp. SAI-127]
MSRTLPPGWYPDPDAPHLERWWDGTAWTDHRRAPAGPGPPRPAGGASGRAKAVALTTSGVVLVAAIVSGAFALARGDGDDVVADTAPTVATPPPSTASPAPSRLDDELDGISLPLPEGWVPAKYVTRDNVVMTTDGGRVFTRTLPATPGVSPASLAKKDIRQAADSSYAGIRTHRVVGSEPVAVAGCTGYQVRWRVKTAQGAEGYVQSLAFTPAPGGPRNAVVVRFAFDAGPDGPPLADMDRITNGIRSLGR